MDTFDRVTTKVEAEQWFLNHSEGYVVAVNRAGAETKVETYTEAVAWIEA